MRFAPMSPSRHPSASSLATSRSCFRRAPMTPRKPKLPILARTLQNLQVLGMIAGHHCMENCRAGLRRPRQRGFRLGPNERPLAASAESGPGSGRARQPRKEDRQEDLPERGQPAPCRRHGTASASVPGARPRRDRSRSAPARGRAHPASIATARRHSAGTSAGSSSMTATGTPDAKGRARTRLPCGVLPIPEKTRSSPGP